MNKDSDISAVAFVGKQNSGKTTLLVQVVAELVARGVHVGTVKHHSHAGFEFDTKGKDSWQHRQAGSVYTVISAPDQIASVRSIVQEPPLSALIGQMVKAGADGSTPLDIVLVEGYRQSGLPTIELFRAANPKDAERELGGEGNEIVAVVTDIPRVATAASSQGLPVYAFDAIAAIADFVTDFATDPDFATS